MKIILLFFFLFSILTACSTRKIVDIPTSKTIQKSTPLLSSTDSISYALGNNLAKNFLSIEKEINGKISLDVDYFLDGIKDTLRDSSKLTKQEKEAILEAFAKTRALFQQQEAKRNKKEGKQFLIDNKKKKGIITTTSGLQYKIVKQGDGEYPSENDIISVHYVGTFIDGSEFDNSRKRDQPATFRLDNVIQGWIEGIQLMKEGSIFEFYIPNNLAYGDRSMGSIPSGSVLIYKIELISVF